MKAMEPKNKMIDNIIKGSVPASTTMEFINFCCYSNKKRWKHITFRSEVFYNWVTANGEYCFSEPTVRHDDGHISGGIFKLQSGSKMRTGSYYINSNGSVRRIPALLRAILVKWIEQNGLPKDLFHNDVNPFPEIFSGK